MNDYLAEYQSELMARVHRFLGLTRGCILSNQDPTVRREQYAADITYGTNNEFGFDYLLGGNAEFAAIAELAKRALILRKSPKSTRPHGRRR